MFSSRYRQILRSERRLEDRYMLSAVLILSCIVAFALVGDGKFGRFVVVALEGVTLLVVLRSSQVRPRTVQVAGMIVVVALVAVAVSSSSSQTLATVAPGIVGALLACVGPIVIARRLLRQNAVDFRTVAGAVCIYLLAGLFFAFAYWTMGAIQGNGFFAQPNAGSSTDFVYYSFITLTTVGFGDLTAMYNLGRLSSALEALFGQLYLVSVVALLVSNVGHVRRPE